MHLCFSCRVTQDFAETGSALFPRVKSRHGGELGSPIHGSCLRLREEVCSLAKGPGKAAAGLLSGWPLQPESQHVRLAFVFFDGIVSSSLSTWNTHPKNVTEAHSGSVCYDYSLSRIQLFGACPVPMCYT